MATKRRRRGSGAADATSGAVLALRAEMASGFTSMRDELRGAFAVLGTQLTVLAKDVGELRGEVSALRGEISALRGEVSALRGEVSALRGEVRELSVTVAAHGGRLDRVEAEVAQLRGDVAGVRAEVQSRPTHADLRARTDEALEVRVSALEAGKH